ncbi:hypothetical protein J3R74_003559 [Puniceicoccus vermicola]
MESMPFPFYPFLLGGGFSALFWIIGLAWSCLVIALHIAIFIGISQDAKRKESGGLFFFGPTFWGLCGLVFGLLGLGVYWLIHHSNLRRSAPVGREPIEPHSVIRPKPPSSEP